MSQCQFLIHMLSFFRKQVCQAASTQVINEKLFANAFAKGTA